MRLYESCMLLYALLFLTVHQHYRFVSYALFRYNLNISSFLSRQKICLVALTNIYPSSRYYFEACFWSYKAYKNVNRCESLWFLLNHLIYAKLIYVFRVTFIIHMTYFKICTYIINISPQQPYAVHT